MRCGETIETLFKLLPRVQRIILLEIDEESANQIVERISRKYNLPKSTIWYNLKKLKEKGIIFYENGSKIKVRNCLKILKKLGKNLKGEEKRWET